MYSKTSCIHSLTLTLTTLHPRPPLIDDLTLMLTQDITFMVKKAQQRRNLQGKETGEK
jgi:hypothetical protein